LGALAKSFTSAGGFAVVRRSTFEPTSLTFVVRERRTTNDERQRHAD